MKKLVVGILAHVDAGKTTLSEGLLYLCGRIRKLGRVDHKDAFLDTYELEKERGITIFSKQAVLEAGDTRITLLDTPGHVDFSAEMERTLQVLDYAILVISGSDGIQGHTMTLWRLLERYGIPTFLFINKMDQPDTDSGKLMAQLTARLSGDCVDFTAARALLPGGKGAETAPEALQDFMENLASCEEGLLERYLETNRILAEDVAALIRDRRCFPCYFGSALKMTGVDVFFEGLQAFTCQPPAGEEFGARVFKIARDEAGNRLTYLKVCSGRLAVKTLLSGMTRGESWEEKADQLRLYSGARYEAVKEAGAGEVVAVTGLTRTLPGDGLGVTPAALLPTLEPVLDYRVLLPADCDAHRMLRDLKLLEEEDPQLHIRWEEQTGEIHTMLMGEVQTQILKTMIWERYHVAVEFDAGNVVYRETIAAPVIGVGHFEPLRHYAEVHLLMEPGEPGSGLVLSTAVSEDVLDRNWQRLILTHLAEREHPGVLTGAPVTDMQITLINGRAHLKHTEGGDFRQATYRAVRQGLMQAENILLEPWYEYRMELPQELVGRAMTDIQKMEGTVLPPEAGEDGLMILTGRAPVSAMREYPRQVLAYSGGRGRIFCAPGGYAPCGNQEEAVAASGYDPEADGENPTGSVFCAHGAGFIVPWDQVPEYMHLTDAIQLPGQESEEKAPEFRTVRRPAGAGAGPVDSYAQEKELQAIFERTFGPVKSRVGSDQSLSGRVYTAPRDTAPSASYPAKKRRTGEDYLLVDGYNIIFGWEDLAALAKTDIHAAQGRLMDVLSNYQGLCGCNLILVFDAYKVAGHQEEILKYHNIYVVYTKEAETADMYIEKTVHRLARGNQVTVATSDGLEQIIILGQGASRISAKGLRTEIEEALTAMRTELGSGETTRSVLIDRVDEKTAAWMKERRLRPDDTFPL